MRCTDEPFKPLPRLSCERDPLHTPKVQPTRRQLYRCLGGPFDGGQLALSPGTVATATFCVGPKDGDVWRMQARLKLNMLATFRRGHYVKAYRGNSFLERVLAAEQANDCAPVGNDDNRDAMLVWVEEP